MLYMVVEHFNAGAAPAVYRRVRETGRHMPAGLEYLDSWVDLDFGRCYQLMRTDDPTLFDAWILGWQDLVRFEVIAVRTSADAARLMAEER